MPPPGRVPAGEGAEGGRQGEGRLGGRQLRHRRAVRPDGEQHRGAVPDGLGGEGAGVQLHQETGAPWTQVRGHFIIQ